MRKRYLSEDVNQNSMTILPKLKERRVWGLNLRQRECIE